jgi:hypothetical protein
VWLRKSKQPASREELVVKLDSLRPEAGGTSGVTCELLPEEVTGVIGLALERLQAGAEDGGATLRAATERLLDETTATRALAIRLSQPPPQKR